MPPQHSWWLVAAVQEDQDEVVSARQCSKLKENPKPVYYYRNGNHYDHQRHPPHPRVRGGIIEPIDLFPFEEGRWLNLVPRLTESTEEIADVNRNPIVLRREADDSTLSEVDVGVGSSKGLPTCSPVLVSLVLEQKERALFDVLRCLAIRAHPECIGLGNEGTRHHGESNDEQQFDDMTAAHAHEALLQKGWLSVDGGRRRPSIFLNYQRASGRHYANFNGLVKVSLTLKEGRHIVASGAVNLGGITDGTNRRTNAEGCR